MGDEEQAGTEQVSSPEQETQQPTEPSFEERLEQRLNGLEQLYREQNARISGVQSVSDRAIATLDQLKRSFDSEFGHTKKSLRLFETYVRSNLGDEALKEWERDEQLDELRQSVEDKRRAEAVPPGTGRDTIAADAVVEHEFQNSILPELREYAQQVGLALELVVDKLPARRGEATATDPRGWRGYVREAKEIIRREQAHLANQNKPRAQVDTGRSAGGGSPTRFTREQIADPEFYAEHREAILKALAPK